MGLQSWPERRRISQFYSGCCFWHTLAPAFQKLSSPRYLVDQRDFYLHMKLHLCGLEIPACRVATALGHDWRFPQADFLHSPACPSPLLPECQADLAQGLFPTLRLWRRGFMGSSQKGWRCSHWVPLASKHLAQHYTKVMPEADGVKHQVQCELTNSCINSY